MLDISEQKVDDQVDVSDDVKMSIDSVASRVEPKRHPKMLKNVLLLSTCSAFGFAAAFSQISTTSIAAKELNGPATSTIPLGALLLSAAISAGILPRKIQRYGAKRVFVTLMIAATLGSILEFLGLYLLDPYPAFVLLCVGAVPQGFAYAAVNYFRLSAAEFSDPEFVPKAMAIVIGGGLFSTVLGPELVKYSRGMFPERNFSGTYIHIAILWVALAITLSLVDFKPGNGKPDSEGMKDQEMATNEVPVRSTREIVLTRKFLGVMYLQTVAFSSMGALMAATPIAMVEDGFTFVDSTTAIISHMLGMYVPSLFVGMIIKKFKPYPVACAGFSMILIGAGIFLAGRSIAHYIVGITVVGVGWNFAFVPMSAVVTTLYTPAEKAGCQAVNEITMIGILGVALFTTGFLYSAVLWDNFVIVYMVYTAPALLYVLFELIIKGTRA